ncbi:MAG TPA: cation-translocating P-type ATPase [Lachnospiraceae bacterium]|nr:cation-translocating P-type ATPase [Lachnospiraceae bacterium]
MHTPNPPLSNAIRGQNVLEEAHRKNVFQRFLEQMNDPLIFILFIAAAISMLLREFSDTAIILAVILLNAIVGLIQEGKAKRALDSLKEMTSPKAIILDKGQPTEISASDLIPGDLVLLDAGRQIPADLILTESQSLKVEESALTGESLPVEKDTKHHNQAFMSTNVTYGRGIGRVSAIGMNTEIGKIAQLINEAPEETTPLQKRLADLGKVLSVVSLVLCALLFGIALLQKRDVLEMLITAISLAVAAVPEGLPAIVTMVLALSVSRMVKVNTIIKRLPSVETLGCVSVVCSDKTGTLTQNKMSVSECFSNNMLCTPHLLNREQNRYFLEGFTLCNDAVLLEKKAHNQDLAAAETLCTRMGDPTELALLDMTAGFHLYRSVLESRLPRIDEIAFDSDRKMMSTMHRQGNTSISYTKGSPDEIIKRSRYIWEDGHMIALTQLHKTNIYHAIKSMSEGALRILALGMKTGDAKISEKDLTFIGLVGMKDPLRPEAKAAVDACHSAGVRTIMITGDRVDTACAIAKELGIADDSSACMAGSTLNALSGDALIDALKNVNVFAQVSPEHKTKIVTALKARGEIVAMTGDGVNDAPSLKSADVGIAMGITGTDVAKNAADIILTDDNFSTIVKAIEQGRSIYANIKKSVLFLLSSNFGEIITMLAAILCGFSSPLKPSHILWINLITDSLPALALGIDISDTSHFMKKPPRPKEEHLFAGGGLACTLIYGNLIAFISISAFLLLPVKLLMGNDLPVTLENLRKLLTVPEIITRSQTYAFTVLGMSQLFHAIGMRDMNCSVFKMKHLSNRLMIIAVIVGFGLQLMVTICPYFTNAFGTSLLHASDWRLLLFFSAMPLVAHEILLLPKLLKPKEK